MNSLTVSELLRQGENSMVEFKTTEVIPEVVAKEMVAFANASGGNILIGVADNGTVTGLDLSKNYEEWCMNIARNNVIPSLNITFSTVTINDKTIALIEIPKGNDKPYQTNDYKYLIRIGSTNRVASSSELMQLFQEAGVFHYDKVGIEKTDILDLNPSKVDEYFRRHEIDFSKEPNDFKINLLTNTEILTANGNVTVAGLLYFGINPSRFLYQSGIMFAHFKGNILTDELIDRQSIEGDMEYIINTCLAVIKNNFRIPSVVEGMLRMENNILYSDKVYRELITNACAHRNYSIIASQIRVFMFDNRIEFMSPGNLPNSVTLEKLYAGVSYARNPVLVKFLANTRYIDSLGQGIPYVLNSAKKLGKKVTFEEIGEEFKVTLYY